MENTQMIPMEFESSNGTLLVNENGSINENSDFDNDSWLSDISKVDIEELDNYYKLQGLVKCEFGDVLDFGWWKGNYNKPDRDWRMETFHKQDLEEAEVNTIILIKMFPSFATEDECEITKREYNSMMSACTTKQKELMNSIFGAEPFKKKVMFMCTKDFGFDFSKGKEYEFVSVTSDGYKLINEHNDVHTISVGKWADYFYRID
jgi:hypothetical protein